MRFIIDAQLPPALAGWLNSEGYNASHVIDLGLIAAADCAIWDYAESNSSAIITKDEDFAIRAMHEQTGPAIVWVRIGNCGNDQLQK